MCSWLKASVPLAAALIVLSAGAASAQDELTVKVPFAFEVRGRHYRPASTRSSCKARC